MYFYSNIRVAAMKGAMEVFSSIYIQQYKGSGDEDSSTLHNL